MMKSDNFKVTTPATAVDESPPDTPSLGGTLVPLHRARSAISIRTEPRGLLKHVAYPANRRLSMSHGLLQRKSSLSIPKPILRPWDEASKTQQFERMMDKFQLRRVALSRQSSSISTAPLTTQRETHRLGTHSSTQVQPQDQNDQVLVHPREDPTTTFDSPPRSLPIVLREPITPGGYVSQLRLGAVTIVYFRQIVHTPFVLVYPDAAKSWTSLDLVSDIIFLSSMMLLCRTTSFTARGRAVSSTRAIMRQYHRHGLMLDILAPLPIELASKQHPWAYQVSVLIQMSLRTIVVRRQWSQLSLLRLSTGSNQDHHWLDWLLYSRFGHLIRICRVVLLVMLLAHYLACAWSYLNLSIPHKTELQPYKRSWATHLHSMYDVLQLLQGQGVETVTVAQDIFGSITMLLGSIALAVIFGHVAILVSNFSANQTAYQRKLEHVFAIMEKLQLPQPIRERVHEYYEYLHTEYESLDGEIFRFAKDLSHTLELEVVLFKYMDVVTCVPHWCDCSADFQKQLVLNLTVRVYLPDDFIYRRGEVGSSCFIISEGVCHQYHYEGGNDEYPSPPLGSVGQASVNSPAPRDLHVNSSRASRYVVPDRELSAEGDSSERGMSFLSLTLSRGQVVGELALISNYHRTSDLRASTYVEMCVLKRKVFQKILTRYPRDRELVLTSIVRACMEKRAAQGAECRLIAMVQQAIPAATPEDAIPFVVQAMNPSRRDPSILFGATDDLQDEMRRVLGTEHAALPAASSVVNANLRARVEQLEGQLATMSSAMKSLLCSQNRNNQVMQHGMSMRVAQKPPHTISEVATIPRPATVQPVMARQRRIRRRISLSALGSPTHLPSHTTYADRLFSAKKQRA